MVAVLTLSASAQSRSLIGRWITGPEDLTDKSGFTPVGTHDGVAVGTTENVTFDSGDIPPRFAGSSLNLGGNAAIMITNSASSDGGFLQTFNNDIADKFSTVFWYKGQPGGWNPLVSKAGESGIGWQVRALWDNTKACFTIRSTPGNDDPGGNNNTHFTDGNWHMIAATWDGVTGRRKLYIDGVLDISLTGDYAPMGMAPSDHLIIGGRQTWGGGIGNWFTGHFADVRMYNYALSAGEVIGLYNPPTTSVVTFVDALETNRWVGMTAVMDIIVPTAATVSGSYNVTLTTSAAGVLGFQGVAGDKMNLVIPKGVNVGSVTLVGVGAGTATITASGLGYASSSVGFSVFAENTPALVGHWFTGAADYADKSGFTPVGTHDGFAVGPAAGSESFVSDVPTGTGQSLSLPGDVAIAITNSVNTNGNYLQTFDANVAVKQTVAFWAKGAMPTEWSPWVSKRGENDRGYRIGRHGDTANATYTLRGTPAEDDVQSSRPVNDGNWHHFTGTWDGTTGERKLYVDGLLQYVLTKDYAPITMANGSYLVLGGIDQDEFGRFLPGGQLFDVRVYNYALSEAQILDLVFPGVGLSPASASIMATRTNSLRVSIPSSANQSASVTVYVTNNAPTIADLPGSAGNVLAVVFAAGATPIQDITVMGLRNGTADYSAGSEVLTSGSCTFAVTRNTLTVLGQWFTGSEDYDDHSGYWPGVHDGMPVGATAFAADAPPGYGGSCLDLSGVGSVVVSNSYTGAGAGYQTTFDDLLKSGHGFALTFWMKGWGNDPGKWWYTPMITKNTDDWDTGWGVRSHTDNNNVAEFHLGGVDRWWAGPVPSIASRDFQSWHHYAAVFDPSGVKRIYVDGVLSKEQNCGKNFSVSKNSALVIGGVDKHSDATAIIDQAKCKFFDVRIYGKAITGYDIYGMAYPSTTNLTIEMTYSSLLVGNSGSIKIRAPYLSNATQPVTVYLTNSSPGVVSINGSTDAVIPITIAAGAVPVTNVTITALSAGPIALSVGGVAMISAATTGSASKPALVGRWVSGAQNLLDGSGYTAAGTHDGKVIGTTSNMYVFSTNVPPGFSGYALDLTTNGAACYYPDGTPMTNAEGSQLYGEVAVAIDNSATTDVGYLHTFDNPLSVSCTIAFWANGVPGNWAPFVSKFGEDGLGYQVRLGGNTAAAFTVRGTSNEDGVGAGDITTNTAWFHIAAVRDAVTGIRKVYVNGVLDLNLSGDTKAGTMAPAQHFVLGGRERPSSFEGWFTGLLYDVRVYNYPLSQSEVNNLLTPTPPSLAIHTVGNDLVMLTWPADAAGFVLQTNSVLPGVWGDSTHGVTTVGSQNVVTNLIGGDANFYRLIKRP